VKSFLILIPIILAALQSEAGYTFDSIKSAVQKVSDTAQDLSNKATRPNPPSAAQAKASTDAPSVPTTASTGNGVLTGPEIQHIQEDCTMKDESLNQLCVEFKKDYKNRKYQGQEMPAHYDDLSRCFYQAKWYDNSYSPLDGASQTFEKGPQQDTYVKECIRLTDKVTASTKWRDEITSRQVANKFYEDLRAKVEKDFPSKCDGVIASNTSVGRIRLTVSKRTNSKKVVYQGKDIAGDKLTIFCSGDIETKFASGGSSYAQGESFEKTNADQQQSMCMLNCASSKKSLACLNANGNVTDPACRKTCEPKCP
jgi:hypothetical protein